MPCSTDDRSHRKYYERLTPIETLERHLVHLGKDANPNETKNEPNYEDWGEDHAKLDYVGLIAYTVAAINELREMVEELENA
jgi:hypothetical protein